MKSFLGGMVGGLVVVLLCGGLALLSWYTLLEDVEGEYQELTELDFEWANQELREVMLKVESYHRIFGFYPESLGSALGANDSYDSLTQDCECGESSDYFYKVLAGGTSYSLFSKGPDCKPFTEDDHHLEIPEVEKSGLGITLGHSQVAATDTNICTDT